MKVSNWIELLIAILILSELKLTGSLSISWWLVFSPLIAIAGILVVVGIIALIWWNND